MISTREMPPHFKMLAPVKARPPGTVEALAAAAPQLTLKRAV